MPLSSSPLLLELSLLFHLRSFSAVSAQHHRDLGDRNNFWIMAPEQQTHTANTEMLFNTLNTETHTQSCSKKIFSLICTAVNHPHTTHTHTYIIPLYPHTNLHILAVLWDANLHRGHGRFRRSKAWMKPTASSCHGRSRCCPSFSFTLISARKSAPPNGFTVAHTFREAMIWAVQE